LAAQSIYLYSSACCEGGAMNVSARYVVVELLHSELRDYNSIGDYF